MLNMNSQPLFGSRGDAVFMANDRILVVDDEEDLAELVRYNWTKEGYQVTCVGSGEQALGEAREQIPDLIVLDLLLPKVDGLDVCKQLKSDPKTQHIPILMLTAKSEEVDMVTGLECGADDYVTKPFSPRVLLARIRSVLRRRAKTATAEDDDPEALRIANLLIHPGRHEVLVNGTPIDLTFTEFRLLHFLARKPGWAFSRSQIVDAVKGEDYPVTERSVDVQVVGLRKKLGALGSCIETVRGVGYRFKE
jgi:two-component system phosphate regulon response regulator PhoB